MGKDDALRTRRLASSLRLGADAVQCHTQDPIIQRVNVISHYTDDIVAIHVTDNVRVPSHFHNLHIICSYQFTTNWSQIAFVLVFLSLLTLRTLIVLMCRWIVNERTTIAMCDCDIPQPTVARVNCVGPRCRQTPKGPFKLRVRPSVANQWISTNDTVSDQGPCMSCLRGRRKWRSWRRIRGRRRASSRRAWRREDGGADGRHSPREDTDDNWDSINAILDILYNV